MDATECASDKDGGKGDEESEVQFYVTVPEQELTLKAFKRKQKIGKRGSRFKIFLRLSEEPQLNSRKVLLSKAMKANDVTKLELQALRKKVHDQKSKIDEMYESQDDLEQYTSKNSLEIHGVPEDLYTSTEDVVIKLGEVLNVPIQSDDIDISHKLYSGKNKPKNIIVKLISHKKKTARYKMRTELKNVRITHSTTATVLAAKRLYINENLTSFRKDLMKEANQMKTDGLLVSV